MRQLKHPDIDDVPLTAVLHALSDPVRLAIVRMAARQPDQPCSAFLSQIPKSTLSHHWRVLRDAGLIRQVSAGREKLNTLRKDELDARFPGLLDAVLASAEH
ncbi:MAG: helix-turn-helix transcriptional regulator [Sumerlaeia bacterium]